MRTSFSRLLLTSLFAISSLVICWGASVPQSFGTEKSAPAVLKSAYGHPPLVFEPNTGQTDPSVRFLARTRAMTVFFTDTEAVMVLSRSEQPLYDPQRRLKELPKLTQTVVRMKLVGAQKLSEWTGLDKQPGISNYFVGNDPKQWRTSIPNYGRAEARGVYPGVDLICYGTQGQLEYDLAVAPGADPAQVQLAWEGTESLRLNANGDLVLATQLGDVVQKRPRVYQEIGGKQVEVASKYVLAQGNRVRFELARYDRSRRLWIDPVVLAYSTYLGGSSNNYPSGIAVDTAGSAYVVGYTQSTNFPTDSAYQSTYQGGWDAFVTKLAATGSALVYSTYLGGSGYDQANGIAVDATGSAYVVGDTQSANFPTMSPFQSTLQGSENAFVTKLAPAGNALVYSTYLGGSREDIGLGIAVDAPGAAYVTGNATSTNFPLQSPFQSTFQGDGAAFVTKLAPTGNALVYSTYLGGSDSNGGSGIAVDSTGAAYVTGYTDSPDFPTQSAYQATYQGGMDAFVTKLAPAGNALVYSTYLGGSSRDVGSGIAVDSTGAAYVAGYTYSANFPTQSAYQATYPGEIDAFVTKLAPAGNALAYSTYLGGSSNDSGQGIAVDASGSAYVVGYTQSTNFPTQSAYQATLQGGGLDAFVTKLAPAGNALAYSTYLGGSGPDQGFGIAVDATGAAYVTGFTGSVDFPTESAYQNTNLAGASAYTGFVTKFAPFGSAPATPAITTLSPSSATAGGAAFSLAVNGSGFVQQSVVQWNGSSLATTYVSSTQLTASVPANLIAAAGVASISVVNAGNLISNIVLFSINTAANTVPSITGLSPSSVAAGSPAFSLVVNGTNFASTAVVQWNGSSLSTTFVSETELIASVPANLVASQGSASITVLSPGGTVSNTATFFITAATASTTASVPEFGTGGGFITGFYVVNSGDQPASFTITFRDDNGDLVSLSFNGLPSASALSDTIPAYGSGYYEAGNPAAALVAGSALVSSEPSITVQGIFRRHGADNSYYEAAIFTSGGNYEVMFPFDDTTFAAANEQIFTGIAIANMDPMISADVTCTARDPQGNIIPNAVSVPALNPLGHWANYSFPALTGLRGTLDCSSNTKIGVIALRFLGYNGMASLPVIPIR